MSEPEPRRSRSTPMLRRVLVGLVVCALVGGGAWAGLREPGEPAESVAAPVPHAGIPPAGRVDSSASASEPLQVSPPVTPRAAGDGTAPAAVKPKPVKFSAPLTVSSEPWGTLYLDDMEIGPTPVTGYVLTQGRHRLRIEQEGYRTTVDFIVVTSPSPIRREYNLEPGGP